MENKTKYKIWTGCSWGAIGVGILFAAIGGITGCPESVIIAGVALAGAGIISWAVKAVVHTTVGK